MKPPIIIVILFLIVSCDYFDNSKSANKEVQIQPVLHSDTLRPDTTPRTISTSPGNAINSNRSVEASILAAGLTPDTLVAFAKTMLGVTYKYASIDPTQGFDCSGFITYVFNHFKVTVPRSSKDFENVGTPVDVHVSRPGDLILFTGTDSTERIIGHMGIIISNEGDNIQFIHSSSGKAYGVVITPLNDYYKGRFMKVIRIFK